MWSVSSINVDLISCTRNNSYDSNLFSLWKTELKKYILENKQERIEKKISFFKTQKKYFPITLKIRTH